MIKTYLKKYFVTAMGAMAQGLFATLLIGTIINTLGKYTGLAFLTEMASFASAATGMAIGVAIAISLKSDMLVVLCSAVVGSMGYSIGAQINETLHYTAGPAGAFFAVIIACEVARFVSKKTKVDILVTPLVTIFVGYGVSKLLSPGIAYVMYYLGNFINTTTEWHPFIMGIIIAVVVGMILTLPISSAAICAMIGITSLAGGAATVGCCAQMVGFAAMSFRENGVSGLVSQGLGTSMLQMGNICKNPKIWIPPTVASAVCGPLATMLFKLKCDGVSAGMGTCGLVGPLGIISSTDNSVLMWVGIILLCIVLPAAISLALGELFRKIGWIKEGDLKLEV
ncbi:MAG: PTS transporter subunit IIC [Eubacteriales bacterium]